MSVGLVIEDRGLGRAAERLARLGSRAERFDLLEAVGTVAESGARRRLAEEKRAPDGEPWAPWSETTRARREARHSLLQFEGDLRDSIRFAVDPRAEFVEVGSNLAYAAVHQLGSRGEDDGSAEGARRPAIPARPYLGLSAEDAELAEAAAVARLERALEGGR